MLAVDHESPYQKHEKFGHHDKILDFPDDHFLKNAGEQLMPDRS